MSHVHFVSNFIFLINFSNKTKSEERLFARQFLQDVQKVSI
jgi:hypothetical protein